MSANNHGIKQLVKSWIYYLPLSDKQFTELMYLYYFRRPLHLDPPVTFNEKIHWLKLFGGIEKYTSLVDKYDVRSYVSSRIGSQYLNELYGVFNNENEIDFDVLPQRFILKATHGSGWNIICKDKGQLDINSVRNQLKKWLGSNFYKVGKEPNYKNICPRIICEHFLENEIDKKLFDYKFFCFEGRVQFIQVDFDRYVNHTRNIYDKNWDLCPFTFLYANNPINLKRPEKFETMIEVAEALADRIPFVRVDLYYVNSMILFGEMSFTPESGFGIFKPAEWDYKLGTYLQLPESEKLDL